MGRGGGGGGGVSGACAASHMKRLNKTESPIIVLKRVLCFQRQFFRLLFYFIVAVAVRCGGHKMSPRTSV